MKTLCSVVVLMTTMLVVGCKSTPKAPNDFAMHIVSDKSFTWAQNKSLALNVARLAQPAGVGVGLLDSRNPEQLEIHRRGNPLVSAISGFLHSGVLGAVSYTNLDGQVESNRSWRPAIVSFESWDAIYNARAYRQRLAEAIVTTVKVSYPDTTLVGAYASMSDLTGRTTLIYYHGQACDIAWQFGVRDSSQVARVNAALVAKRFASGFDYNGEAPLCLLSLETSVTGRYGGKAIVVNEVKGDNQNLFMVDVLLGEFEKGAVIIPDKVRAFVSGEKYRSVQYHYPHPAVTIGQYEYLFDGTKNATSLSVESLTVL